MSRDPARELVYVADPMCSWCWGFAPVLAAVRRVLPADVRETLVLGGLAPDSNEPMDAETRRYVQAAWDAVEARTGASFERSFWTECVPSRSTWPACRAVLAAERLRPGAGRALFEAIQHAYYLEARNPSERTVLAELAAELAPPLDGERLTRELDRPETRERLELDRRRAARLGARGFPWLGLVVGTTVHPLARGFRPAGEVLAALTACLPPSDPGPPGKGSGNLPPSYREEDWGSR